MPTYTLSSQFFLTGEVRGSSFIADSPENEQRRTLRFHILHADYFATLATILSLVADSIQTDDSAMKARAVEILKGVHDDLMYLQDSYDIVRK